MGIGLLPCSYAISVLILRLQGKNGNFRKLSPMKQKDGNKAGSGILYFGYVFVPRAVGLFIFYSGIKGLDLNATLFSL